ncbi:MAG: phenylalanine--tRNA ligase subunit beta [Actinobacteria bacterium]|nr:phenylalanine--tRNA ligase subunit beta [Actinomycetota bacterium]
MKVPLSWLQRFVDVDDLSLDELVDVMSLHGLEVEEVHVPGAGTTGVRTKRVVSWSPHPDADKLRVVRVTDGTTETELVCGAANFDVGDVVAHAEVGATIPAPAGRSAPFRLEARELRGVVSNGMLCSARELQLGDDHDGIMVLAADTPLGADLVDLLPVGEPVIEVAVLADRGDHHAILGIAREVAAILDREVRGLSAADGPAAEGVPVDLTGTVRDDLVGCSRFVAWTVEDVTVAASPWWLRQRLAQCGIRSINNVVDVTNLVMLETGQPLHAFDLDRLHGPQLTVRWASPDETLVTLDDQERELLATDLVIADADRLVSLAGVMGGADSEVSAGTSRVLLEGATWDPLAIRRTSRRLNLVSEASLRFERRVDPAMAPVAVARAAELLAELGGGRIVAATTATAGPAPDGPARVVLDTRWCARFLGLDGLDAGTQEALLRRVGCTVEAEDATLTVTPPSWRGDLTRPADLAEEVARLYGYERIPATMPAVTLQGGLSPAQRAERRLRETVLAAGFHEVRGRPFVGTDALEGVAPSDGRVQLANPLAKDAAAMAPTLVEGLLQVVRRNVGQGRPGTAVFELARIFRPAGDVVEASLEGFGDGWRWTDPDGVALPTQPRVLALAAQGLRTGPGWLDEDESWDVYDLLAVLDAVVAGVAPPEDPADARSAPRLLDPDARSAPRLLDPDARSAPRLLDPWRLEREPVEREGFHPGRTAALVLRGVEVGVVAQLHPTEADRRDLVEPVVVAELLLEPLLEHLAGEDPSPVQAVELVRHPAMTVDVALVADESVTYAELEAAARAGAGELLDELWFFDEYRGSQLGEGERSIAMRLRLQSPERQLTDDDAEAVIAAVGREAAVVGARLRA